MSIHLDTGQMGLFLDVSSYWEIGLSQGNFSMD